MATGTTGPESGAPRVLVVEDERSIADLIRLYLGREGFGHERPGHDADVVIGVELDQGRVSMALGEQQWRAIASLRLPYLNVAFRFAGWWKRNLDLLPRHLR